MIEESGENWYLYSPTEHPHSIQVLTDRVSVERTETTERGGKKRKKPKTKPFEKPKTKPFGFSQALKPKKGKR